MRADKVVIELRANEWNRILDAIEVLLDAMIATRDGPSGRDPVPLTLVRSAHDER